MWQRKLLDSCIHLHVSTFFFFGSMFIYSNFAFSDSGILVAFRENCMIFFLFDTTSAVKRLKCSLNKDNFLRDIAMLNVATNPSSVLVNPM